jgi:hypothetical protein
MRIFWICFAAVVFAASLAIHAFTFLGDPMRAIPSVMLLHVLIFPPFIAAILYLRKLPAGQRRIPRWLKIGGGIVGAYAAANFLLFTVLGEGGGPQQRDGKFFLMEHGIILRELTRAEFYQHQAYVVRFFSSGWLLFSFIAFGLLVAVHRANPSYGEEIKDSLEATDLSGRPVLLPAETPRGAGLLAILIYVACVAIIVAGQPLLNFLCVFPLVAFAVIALLRRVSGFPQGQFDTTIGCLSVVPNFFLAIRWMTIVREFLYVAIYAGLIDAVHGRLQVVFSRLVPAHLSNGQLFHARAWAALLVPGFLLLVCGFLGLTYMGEEIGRLLRGFSHRNLAANEP